MTKKVTELSHIHADLEQKAASVLLNTSPKSRSVPEM